MRVEDALGLARATAHKFRDELERAGALMQDGTGGILLIKLIQTTAEEVLTLASAMRDAPAPEKAQALKHVAGRLQVVAGTAVLLLSRIELENGEVERIIRETCKISLGATPPH